MADGNNKKVGSKAAANNRHERLKREREEREERIRQQVADGTLVVRQMTDEERAYWAERRAKHEPESRKGHGKQNSKGYFIDDESKPSFEPLSLQGDLIA